MRLVGIPLTIVLCACFAFAQDADSEPRFREAQQAQQAGNYAAAAEKYGQLVHDYPNLIAARANLGVVLVALGRFDEAVTQYQIALVQAPANSDLLLDLGLAYLKKGDYAGAAAQFAWLHQQDPGDLRAAVLLGKAQVGLDMVGSAAALLEPLEKEHGANLDLEWTLGAALIGLGKTREGLDRVQKVAEQGQNADAYQLAANLYLGLTYFDLAKRDAEVVLRLNPKAAKAHVVLGMVADYAGDAKAAAEEYEKALQLDPTDLQARSQFANALYAQRKLDEARQQLDRALKQEPKFFGARYQLALVEEAEGHIDVAVRDLENVVKQNPDWLPPHVKLAALYYRVKRPDDGAKERTIVDQLREAERNRRDQGHVISPQIPPQLINPQIPRP